MDSPAGGQPTPPLSPVILNFLMVGRSDAAEREPVETAPAVLLILFEVADIDITVGVDLVAKAILLIIGELPFVDPAVLVDGDA